MSRAEQRRARRGSRGPYRPRAGSFAGAVYAAVLAHGGRGPGGAGVTVRALVRRTPRPPRGQYGHYRAVIRTVTSLRREGVVEQIGHVDVVSGRALALYRVKEGV
jgi:hypothetical protein